MHKFEIHHNTNFTLYSTFISKDQAYLVASTKTKKADPILTCKEIYSQIADILKQTKSQIVQERIFGSNYIQADILKARADTMHDCGIYEELPVTYIQGQPFWGEGFSGVQIYAIKPYQPNDIIWTIYDEKIPCGRGWKHSGATFIILQNIHGLQKDSSIDNNRENQTIRMFDQANRLLHQQGATYQNVVRTWIYLTNILEWYGEFNNIRNAKYKEFNLIPTKANGMATEQIYLPASTGIQGNNILGATALMDMMAILREPNAQIEINQTTGSRQRSPFRYGSAFSRMMIIREKGKKLLHISGTASIDEQGRTLFPDNPREQIQRTFDIVDTLIKQEGASLQNICYATVFLKNQKDISIYQEVIKDYGLTEMPAICVIADICRDELLFELDAIVAVGDIEN